MQVEAIEPLREREFDPFVESAMDVLEALSSGAVDAVSSSPARSSAGVRVSARRASSRVSVALAASGSGSALVELDAPSVHGRTMKENVEKLVSHLQLENDVKSLKVTQQRLEQVKNVYEKRHKDLMKKIELQIAQSSVESSNKTLSTIFRWIGVLVAIAVAAVTSVVTGGASVMLIVAAVMALAMAITEEAGGFEAMEKAIAKDLMSKGMSRREAMQEAAYIGMGVQLGVTLLTLAITLGASGWTAGPKAAELAAKGAATAGKVSVVVEKGAEAALKAGGNVQKLAETAANAANAASKARQVSAGVAKAVESAEEVEVTLSKAGEVAAEGAAAGGNALSKSTQGSANAAVKLMTVMTYTNAITQISSVTMSVVTSVINYNNAKKMYKAELLAAEVMDIQATMEAWDAYLEENMEDLKAMMKTVQNQFMRMEEIVSSRLRTATEIADMIGGMA